MGREPRRVQPGGAFGVTAIFGSLRLHVRLRRPLHVWWLVWRRRVWLLLAPLRSFLRLESVPVWTVVLRSIFGRMGFRGNTTMGLAAVSLWRMDFPARPRVGLESYGIIAESARRCVSPFPHESLEAGDGDFCSLGIASWAGANASAG